MAQEMVISKELSYLAELSVGMFEEASYSTSSVSNSVSIRQNRFWLVSSEGRSPAPDPLKLHFVTLGVKAPEGRTFYNGAYDPENSAPPDCFSYDGVTPDARGPGRQAENCGSCKQSMWGSATSKLTGAMVPACRTHKDIVIKIMGVEGAWLLRIPPASIKKQWAPLVDQIKKVAAKEQAKHNKSSLTLLTCVVEATFDDAAMGVLNFRPLGYLGVPETPAVVALARDTEATAQALWGSEGAARAARWPGYSAPPPASPQQAAQNMTRASTLMAYEPTPAPAAPAPAAPAPAAPAPAAPPVVVKAEPPMPSVKRTKPVAAKEAPADVAPNTTDEVHDILKSMGIFDA